MGWVVRRYEGLAEHPGSLWVKQADMRPAISRNELEHFAKNTLVGVCF